MNDKSKKEKLQIKKLLRNKSYMAFWFSSTFSMTSSNLIQFVLSIYVLEITGSGTIFASILSVIILPRLFLTPIAGVLGDRINKVKLLTSLTAMQSLVVMSFSVISYYNKGLLVTWIYVLVILLELIEVFYQAPESALIPELVEKELINEAISFSKIDDGIVYVATPAIGVLIYKWFGITGGLILAGIMFGLSFLFNLFIKPIYSEEKDKDLKKQSFLEDLKEGIDVIKNHEFIKQFMFIVPLMDFFFSSVYAVTVPYLFLCVFKVDESIYGLYNSIVASMTIIVPIFAIPLVKKVKTKVLIINSSIVIFSTLFMIGLTVFLYQRNIITSITFAIILITVIDCLVVATMMPVHMSISILYQKTIPKECLSRVLSIKKMLSLILIPFGNMFFGVITDRLPTYICFYIASLGVFVCYVMYHSVFKKYIET